MSTTIVGNLAVELGISDSQLQAGLAQAITQAQQAGQKMSAAMNQAASSGNSKGMSGFALGLSRMVDDAQYGFRGIINNMEQIGTSAAMAFGASTTAAMGFGAALTLTAIAVNNMIPHIEKLADTRSEFEKMASAPLNFAGSIGFATEEIKKLQEENKKLLSGDATSGLGAWFSRQAKFLSEWNDQNSIGGKGTTLFTQLMNQFNPQTMEQQIQKNIDAGRQAAQNQIKIGIEAPTVRQTQEGFNKGLDFLGQDKAGRREIGKEYADAFKLAAEGQGESVRQQLFAQNRAAGMDPITADQKAIQDMGDAAAGVKEAFDRLSKSLPELKLGEKLDQVYETEAAANRQAFIDRQNKERDQLQERATSIRDRLTGLQQQRMRSEIIGSADVFARNLNAATGEDPVVKAIEEQTKELSKVMEKITELG